MEIIEQMKTTVSLVLPFYNEEHNVERVVTDLLGVFRKSDWQAQLVCVQNGSRDRTGAILHSLATANPDMLVVEVPENKGYGYGIQQGLKVTTGEIVGYIDGDGQVLPENMLQVLERMESERAAKAVRVWRSDGRLRRVISWCYNLLFGLFFNVSHRDANAKPKFLRRIDFTVIAPISNDWFIDPEIIIKAAALGIVWSEVPIEFGRRNKGQSHIRPQTVTEFLINMIRWRFGAYLEQWRRTVPR